MNKAIITTALAALIGLNATVDARTPIDYRLKAAEEQPFKWAPRHEENTWKTFSDKKAKNPFKAVETVTDSDVKWSGADGYSYLEMPDGSLWFAALTIKKEVIAQEEYYTSYAYKGIEVKIFDDNYNQVGYIDSPITVPEGYDYCSAAEVATVVTKEFFNRDNNYEIMVMYNFKPTDAYGAIPYTQVFSLRGATTAAEDLGTMPGYYISAVNASTNSWSENYYMSFFSGEEYTDDEMLYTFDIYTRATYSNPSASILKSFTVDMVYVMSDGDNETLPVVLNTHNGNVYVAVAKYQKTFFEEPFNWFNDALSPDNKYVIELYSTATGTSGLNLASTTEIACEAPADPYMMRSYCLGRFRFENDVTFDFGTGNEPAYILTVNDADMRDNSEAFFAVYDVAGNVIETFGEGTESVMLLSDVPGYPQQYCFVQPDESGVYTFNMVNYPQLDQVASLPMSVTGPDGTQYGLSTSLDRVPGDGSYRYAVASGQGGETAQGEIFHPVLWFDHNGILAKVDRIMGGKNVQMMLPYIAANGLTPYLFNSDVKTEYMAFVLTNENHGTAPSTYQLIVVNEDGELNFSYYFPDEATGLTASLVNISSNPAIWLSYRKIGTDEYVSEFVPLPLNKLEGEGTAENPYLLYTAGDFARIKNNLKAHYRLADDIDFDGTTLDGFSGTFTGSLDGAGHTVSNLVLSGAPIFDMTGEVGTGLTTEIKDITFSHVTLTDATSVIVGSAYSTKFENVYIYALNAQISGKSNFGAIANAARYSSELTGCAVLASDINAPESAGVGGLVYILSNSTIASSAFEGNIIAGNTLGGIAAEIQDAKSTVSNCHVKASLTANNTIGGIAGESGRGLISDCLVEGDITATEAGRSYSYYANGWVNEINVGGIVGNLSRPLADLESGQTVAGKAVTNNVVALASISIPEGDELLATAHRIVGRSSINDDPAILDETYNEQTQDWDTTWGDRLAESGVTDNYAIESLAVVDPALEAGLNSLEGQSIAAAQADIEFFEGLGFKFNGYSNAEPWVFTSSLPALYFESTVGAAMHFDPSTVTLTEGESEYVLLVLENVDAESITVESSDESGCYINLTEIDEDGNAVCEVVCLKPGAYTLTATNGVVSATLSVTGTSGIATVEGEAKSAISFDGSSVTAPACDITVYSVTGYEVARGRNVVSTASLVPGVYVAKASGAAAGTLKFVVK
ncbi:MAG: hypothetical protein HDS81_06950 [Bacteroidales bacterium]|nr:hypothetical protein [Bacteroidales bacterium]